MVTTGSAVSQPCGIRIQQTSWSETRAEWVYLPLEQIDIHAEIVDGLCHLRAPSRLSSLILIFSIVSAMVTLTQTFWQCTNSPTSEARYVFPIPAHAAVCGFEMRKEDGQLIKAVVKEKEAAYREYVEAIQQGKMTGLVEHVTDDGKKDLITHIVEFPFMMLPQCSLCLWAVSQGYR